MFPNNLLETSSEKLLLFFCGRYDVIEFFCCEKIIGEEFANSDQKKENSEFCERKEKLTKSKNKPVSLENQTL